MTVDRDLDELLELADGERPLPPRLEDRLLAEVLTTARGATDRVAPRSSPVEGHDRTPAAEIDLGADPAPRRHRHPSPHRRPRRLVAVVAAAALVAAVGVGAIWAPRGDDRVTTVATEVDPPEGGDDPPVADGLRRLDDDQLCQELSVALADAAFDGGLDAAAVDAVRGDELQYLAAVVEELQRRPALAQDPTPAGEAVTLVRYAALAIDQQSDDASSALSAARAAVGELRLDRACSPLSD